MAVIFSNRRGYNDSTLHFSPILLPDEYESSPTHFSGEFIEPPDYYSFSIAGTGLTYDAEGLPNGGSITAFSELEADKFGARRLSINGISIAANAFVAAAKTADWSDDHALIVAELGGNDRIRTGNSPDSFHGFGGNDVLYGQGSGDRIWGDEGNDKLFGGDGNDTLAGGAGRDIFVFNTALSAAANTDILTDFAHREDLFYLDNAIFRAFADVPVGTTLRWSALKTIDAPGAKVDPNDRIIYDRSEGALYYDADGSGAGGRVKFADIPDGTLLAHTDFVIV